MIAPLQALSLEQSFDLSDQSQVSALLLDLPQLAPIAHAERCIDRLLPRLGALVQRKFVQIAGENLVDVVYRRDAVSVPNTRLGERREAYRWPFLA